MAKKAVEKNKGYVLVEVGRLPGTVQEIALDGNDLTVAAALKGAQLEIADNEVVRVNDEEADMDTELAAGDAVMLVEDITGNS